MTAHALRLDRRLAAPVETVWAWLIDGEKRARWFMGGPTDPRVGGALGLTMRHENLSDDAVPTPERYAGAAGKQWRETITRIDPPRLIAFTWDDGREGEVTITLAADGDATLLTLHHRGITGAPSAISFSGGWGAHLAALQRRIAGEAAPDFWALHVAAERRAAAAIS
jgi:uncharacterized protein YndB with AHSA1/START domain